MDWNWDEPGMQDLGSYWYNGWCPLNLFCRGSKPNSAEEVSQILESTISYAAASREFMGKAYQYLAEDDLAQASEKGWGAAAQMVKAVAEERGWPHRHHRLLYEVIEDLVDENGDGELSRLFRQASALHTNFYENWLRTRAVRQCLRDVQDLVNRLEPLIEGR